MNEKSEWSVLRVLVWPYIQSNYFYDMIVVIKFGNTILYV